ncbi:MAG: T9SS type A sorting domain-containing protein [Chitinophagaceae bacterium]
MPATKTYRLLLLLLLSIVAGAAQGQTGFYVPKKGKVHFNGDSATIFSNVTNQGQLGVSKKAVVNFKGKQWENDPDALITDESNNGNGTTGTGGFVRFITPDTSVGNQQQIVIGGYNAVTKSGASFPNITLANPNGVKLLNASTKIRQQLAFVSGHMHAEDNILVVGDGYPGVISGYNENRFVVTGSTANGGFLLRENITPASGWVAFPIGTAPGAYTPAALKSQTNKPDDFYARVFDSVKTKVTSGADLSATSVNKTWQIGKSIYPGIGAVDINLQHLIADEGSEFKSNRQNTYVSQYINGWDTSYPRITPQAGKITSSGTLVNSGMNDRIFTSTVGSNSYFTKFAKKDSLKTQLWFSGYRKNYQNVWVYWETHPEINQKYFVVQRRLSNETAFSTRGTVQSVAPNGYSLDYLNYGMNDPNNYTGVSYYRLLMISYNGDTTYSNIVAIGPNPGKLGTVLWPNPSNGTFYVGVSMMGAIKTINIYNDIGQLIHYEMVDNRGLIEMHLRTPGVYMVSFIGYDGSVLETKRLIIIGN